MKRITLKKNQIKTLQIAGTIFVDELELAGLVRCVAREVKVLRFLSDYPRFLVCCHLGRGTLELKICEANCAGTTMPGQVVDFKGRRRSATGSQYCVPVLTKLTKRQIFNFFLWQSSFQSRAEQVTITGALIDNNGWFDQRGVSIRDPIAQLASYISAGDIRANAFARSLLRQFDKEPLQNALRIMEVCQVLVMADPLSRYIRMACKSLRLLNVATSKVDEPKDRKSILRIDQAMERLSREINWPQFVHVYNRHSVAQLL